MTDGRGNVVHLNVQTQSAVYLRGTVEKGAVGGQSGHYPKGSVLPGVVLP